MFAALKDMVLTQPGLKLGLAFDHFGQMISIVYLFVPKYDIGFAHFGLKKGLDFDHFDLK